MRTVFILNSSLCILTLIACHAPLPISQPNPQDKYNAISTPTSKPVFKNVGRYEGEFPCADCSGIHVKLTLRADQSYTLIQTYQTSQGPKTFTNSGQFTIHPQLSSCIILDDKGDNQIYWIGPNYIQLRNQNNLKAESGTSYYILKKIE